MLEKRLFSYANDVPSGIQITVAGGSPITPLQAVTSLQDILLFGSTFEPSLEIRSGRPPLEKPVFLPAHNFIMISFA